MTTLDPSVQRNVIVVDDEELFLRFAGIPFRSGFCGNCAWHVHPFTDHDEALGFYAANRRHVDILLADFHMPRRSGTELIREFRNIGPAREGRELPALIMSSDPAAGEQLPANTHLLRKPFTKDDVASALCHAGVVCASGACANADGTAKPLPHVDGEYHVQLG